jgi:hypothetical protein
MPSLGIFRERQTRLSHYRQTLHSAFDATRSHHVSSSLQKPTIMNSSDRRIIRFWPQRPSRRRTHSSKLHFMKLIDGRVWCSAPPRLSPPPLQTKARVDRQTHLSPSWPHLSPSVDASVALVVASVAAYVADYPALKRSYLLALNSNFDDLGYFGKLTQRAT